MIEPLTGRLLHAARLRVSALLVAAFAFFPATAAYAQMRGSVDALPGQDNDFSPYALGAAPDSTFETPLPEPEGEAPPSLVEPLRPTRRAPLPIEGSEPDPYEQLGIRAGAFLLKPSIELFGGHDSTPNSYEEPEESLYWRTRGALDIESDWIRHALRARIEAGYESYDEFPDKDAPDYAADAALRLDAREDLRLDFALRAARDTDTSDDPELLGVTSTSENDRFAAVAGLTYKPNRFSIAPAVEVERRDFGDPDLADRDHSQYEVRLRTGYELSPAVEPFVEVSANERIYDLELNDGGIAHDSKGWRAYAGLRFEPDPIWAVEAKAGYGHQEAEDSLVSDLDGFVARGTLIWRPSVLTELRLNAERDFEASTIECCAMATRWRTGVELEHRFRDWLILTGEVSFENSHYEMTDYTLKDFDAELALEYKFNRTVSAKARVAYERLDSSADGEDYDATIFEVGLRVQR